MSGGLYIRLTRCADMARLRIVYCPWDDSGNGFPKPQNKNMTLQAVHFDVLGLKLLSPYFVATFHTVTILSYLV